MKKTTLILAIAFVLLLLSFAPTQAVQAADASILAQGSASDAYGLEEASKAAGINKDRSLPETIGTVIFIAVSMIGGLFLIMVIYGGFLWMTAGGNQEKTKKAAAIMRNGAIGVVIVLSAYAITKFIIIEILANTSSNTTTYLPAELQSNKIATDTILDSI